jgi:RNA polymerase sigma-70 factor (ECF subfamily)
MKDLRERPKTNLRGIMMQEEMTINVVDDREAFNIIIREYQRRIFAYIFRIVKNYQDAEDLTQDAFIKAYKNMESVKDFSCLNNWLYQIAYRTAVDYLRRPSVKSLILLIDPASVNEVSYEVEYFSEEYNEQGSKIFATLNYKEHTLLTLRVIEEMSYIEIGKVMNKPPSVLRKRYERLIKKLEKEFSDEGGY